MRLMTWVVTMTCAGLCMCVISPAAAQEGYVAGARAYHLPLMLPVMVTASSGVGDARAATTRLLPRRDDHAWEGMLVGGTLGVAGGILLDVAFHSMNEGDGRSVAADVGTVAVSTLTLGVVGLFIGSAFPKQGEAVEGGTAPSSDAWSVGPVRHRRQFATITAAPR
jgi:hypothetical protein